MILPTIENKNLPSLKGFAFYCRQPIVEHWFMSYIMEEFRPVLADRLAITLINRRQICAEDFIIREGGAVEFTKDGRKKVIAAYQTRKQDTLIHPLLQQEFRYGQLMLVQSRILARYLRGDIPEYYPFILR